MEDIPLEKHPCTKTELGKSGARGPGTWSESGIGGKLGRWIESQCAECQEEFGLCPVSIGNIENI